MKTVTRWSGLWWLAVAGVLACDGGRGPERGAAEHRHGPEEPGNGEGGPAADREDHGGGEAAVVRLSPDQRQAAGIEVAAAGPGTLVETLELVARVEPNEDAVAHVTPKVDGIVTEIHVGLGDEVAEDRPLAEIESVQLGERVAAWLAATATVEAARETLATAEQLYEQRLATLHDVLASEIEVAREILAREEELYRQEVSTIRPRLEAEKALRQAELARERQLTTLRAERDQALLDLRVALRKAEIAADAARDQLRALQIGDEELRALADAPLRRSRFTVRAPQAGVIVERHITPNERVDTSTELFTIHDLSRVWTVASVYEKDLVRVRTGQAARVRLDALPDLVLDGEVALIGFAISPKTRTAPVRIVLPNEPIEAWPEPFPLRPGMFGSAEVVTGTREAPVAIPEAAVVHEGELDFVFVAEDEGTFRRVPVEVRGTGSVVEVVRGLEPGQPVVVGGTFTLKSMAKSEELGGGHGH